MADVIKLKIDILAHEFLSVKEAEKVEIIRGLEKILIKRKYIHIKSLGLFLKIYLPQNKTSRNMSAKNVANVFKANIFSKDI